jgi:hypothetical protein
VWFVKLAAAPLYTIVPPEPVSVAPTAPGAKPFVGVVNVPVVLNTTTILLPAAFAVDDKLI